MRQGRDHLAQHPAVALDVRSPHLEEVVEAGRHHVALLDLRHHEHGLVERRQRRLAGVGKPHLDEGDMRLAHLDRVEDRAVACDDPGLLQPLHPRLGWRFRQPDAAGQFHGRDAPFGLQDPQDGKVEAVQIGAVIWH